MSNFRKLSIFGVLVVVFGALLFVVASAFIIDRGSPKILAGIVGALAFPVLPVAWHIWGERRRKARLAEEKKPSKSQLTGRDRFWFRFIGVTLLVVGPMVAMQKFGVVRAAIDHGLWFLPQEPPALARIGEGPRRPLTRVDALLDRIPTEAENALVYTPSGKGEGVIAQGGSDLMAAWQGDIPFQATILEQLNQQKFLHGDPVEMVVDRDLSVAANKRWRAKVDPATKTFSPTLRRELERSPADAIAAFAYAPLHPAELRAIALWMKPASSGFTYEARLEARDVRRAYELLEQLRNPAKLPLPKGCQAELAKLHLELAQYANIVTLRTTGEESVVRDFLDCGNR